MQNKKKSRFALRAMTNEGPSPRKNDKNDEKVEIETTHISSLFFFYFWLETNIGNIKNVCVMSFTCRHY